MNKAALRELLETHYRKYNRPGFIENDPVSLPHRFSRKEDQEITAFFAALIAWGNRKSIISSGTRLLGLMDNAPHEFVLSHSLADLKKMRKFVHRTFQSDDLESLLSFLAQLYRDGGGLEAAFTAGLKADDQTTENALNGFRQLYEESPFFLNRTRKHLPHPAGGSACKRLNMFLRWMVRNDRNGVDFGIWTGIQPRQLVCPLDVHVLTQALRLKLIKRDKSDWKTAVELTDKLRTFDPEDPVRFDFALFGMGIESKIRGSKAV